VDRPRDPHRVAGLALPLIERYMEETLVSWVRIILATLTTPIK
jgi:hypothetical protein